MRWLAVYVALSRVRSLAKLKSRGLDAKILAIIEGGPPDTIPEQFDRYFGAKEHKTRIDAVRDMRAAEWPAKFLKKNRQEAGPRAQISKKPEILVS